MFLLMFLAISLGMVMAVDQSSGSIPISGMLLVLSLAGSDLRVNSRLTSVKTCAAGQKKLLGSRALDPGQICVNIDDENLLY